MFTNAWPPHHKLHTVRKALADIAPIYVTDDAIAKLYVT